MKEKFKLIFQQTIFIAFCELVLLAILGMIYGTDVFFPWYLPGSLVLTAIATALPSLLLNNLENAKYWKLRIVLHFLLLGAMVMTAGHFFHWYNDKRGAVVMFLVFCLIYACVWIATYRGYQKEDEQINKKLTENRK